jgi:hypothetical protein
MTVRVASASKARPQMSDVRFEWLSLDKRFNAAKAQVERLHPEAVPETVESCAAVIAWVVSRHPAWRHEEPSGSVKDPLRSVRARYFLEEWARNGRQLTYSEALNRFATDRFFRRLTELSRRDRFAKDRLRSWGETCTTGNSPQDLADIQEIARSRPVEPEGP